jgi:hypothetical protein
MKVVHQIALQPDGTGIKKWVDIGHEAYGFHKQMGRDVRVLFTDALREEATNQQSTDKTDETDQA